MRNGARDAKALSAYPKNETQHLEADGLLMTGHLTGFACSRVDTADVAAVRIPVDHGVLDVCRDESGGQLRGASCLTGFYEAVWAAGESGLRTPRKSAFSPVMAA